MMHDLGYAIYVGFLLALLLVFLLFILDTGTSFLNLFRRERVVTPYDQEKENPDPTVPTGSRYTPKLFLVHGGKKGKR